MPETELDDQALEDVLWTVLGPAEARDKQARLDFAYTPGDRRRRIAVCTLLWRATAELANRTALDANEHSQAQDPPWHPADTLRIVGLHYDTGCLGGATDSATVRAARDLERLGELAQEVLYVSESLEGLDAKLRFADRASPDDGGGDPLVAAAAAATAAAAKALILSYTSQAAADEPIQETDEGPGRQIQQIMNMLAHASGATLGWAYPRGYVAQHPHEHDENGECLP